MWNVRIFTNYADTSRDADEIVDNYNEQFLLEKVAVDFANGYIRKHFWRKDISLVRTETGGYRACDICSWGSTIEITKQDDAALSLKKESAIMKDAAVTINNLVVNGWYRWNCEHEISPFLVYRVNELEIHVLFINHGKGYVASFFTRLIVEHLRILPTAEIPSDDILKSVCAQFNSTNANMSQLIQFERGIKTLEPYLLHRLSFDPAHPCKLVVRELEWNAKNKAMNLIPTWNKETEAAIADWKVNYPQLHVFVCQKINDTSETMAFKCPRCGQIHTHGLTDGLRNSQCEYLGTSYIVIEEK